MNMNIITSRQAQKQLGTNNIFPEKSNVSRSFAGAIDVIRRFASILMRASGPSIQDGNEIRAKAGEAGLKK
jgi:hypothetical protein